LDGADYSLGVQIITAISSAAAAIFGGYIASRVSNKNAREIEIAKQLKEQKNQDEYARKTRAIVYRELESMSESAGIFVPDSGVWDNLKKRKDEINILVLLFTEKKKILLDITWETRIKLFTPLILVNVQEDYQSFDLFVKMVLPLIDQFKSNTIQSVENLKEKILNLDASGLVDDFKETINLIAQTYPEVIGDVTNK
jgi:hypothetical protein